MNKFLVKFSFGFLIAAVMGGGFAFFSVEAQAKSGEVNYVIQFKNSESVQNAQTADPQINLEKIYGFASDSKFGSYYRFSSAKSLEQIRHDFNGLYKILQVDNSITTSLKTSVLTPDDPGFTKNSANTDKQWGLVKAGFLDAWQKSTGDKKTIIAIVDTGIDGTHEDLRNAKIVKGYDVASKSIISGKSNSDDNGHGTLIAGVIAGTANNSKGIVGAGYNLGLMPIKALDASGSGTSSSISQAIVWATDKGASVINLSLGGMGFGHDTVLAEAISYAFANNVVIIAAAGNDVAVTGGNLDVDPVFPICDDNGKNMIIGVTATDVNDLKPSFANYGKACVDVSAPGRRILSTINHDPATGGISPNSYAYASGTSLAVPFVSAEAGLLKSLYPKATNRQIRDRILATADNVDSLNISQCAGGSCRGFLGSGRINVAASLVTQIITLNDGDLVQEQSSGNFYYINGGKKQLVSPFVRSQRFAFTPAKLVTQTDLDMFSEGSYAEPQDGTLVKSPNDGAVYYMQSGLRRPLTFQVFTMRGYKFSDIVTLTNVEVNSWVEGSFLTPPDNILVRGEKNKTLYAITNGVLHPMNYKFYVERNLQSMPIVIFPDKDILKFSIGDAYIIQ